MKIYQLISTLSAGLLISASAFAVNLPIKADKSYVSPESVPGAQTVDAAKAHELWKDRAWFVDPRKPEQYEAGRIPGSLNIEYDPGTPDQQLTENSLAAEVPKSEAVVFYCNAAGCDRSSGGASVVTPRSSVGLSPVGAMLSRRTENVVL